MGIVRNLLDAGKRFFRIGKENAPVVLQVVSTTGTVLAVIFGVQAGPKAVRLIKEAEIEKGDELTIPEKVQTTWKVFVPTALATGMAIGSGWASLHESAKHNASLATALASADLALAEYQQKTKDIVGEKKEREIRDEIAREKAKPIVEDGTEPFPTGAGEDIFIDTYSGTKFKASQTFLDQACITISERLLNGEMIIDYNELRYEMNLGPIDFGERAFFTPENKPKFTYTHTPGEPYVAVSFAPGCEPKLDIKRYYR